MREHKNLNVPEGADSPKTKGTLVQMRELTCCFNRWEYQRVELGSSCAMLRSTFQHILNINRADLFAFHLIEQHKMCICWVTDNFSLKLIEGLAL